MKGALASVSGKKKIWAKVRSLLGSSKGHRRMINLQLPSPSLLPRVQKLGFIYLVSWQVIRILKWLENSNTRDGCIDTETVGAPTKPFTQQVSVAEIVVFVWQQEAKEVNSLIRVERMKSRQDGYEIQSERQLFQNTIIKLS
jgi:hypothetical protein